MEIEFSRCCILISTWVSRSSIEISKTCHHWKLHPLWNYVWKAWPEIYHANMEETFWFVSNSHNGWPISRLLVVGLIQWSVYVWLATCQRGLIMVCSVKHKDCQYRIYPKNYAHKSLCCFCCRMALVVFIHIHIPLHWRHNEHNGVSNHQPHGCLLNRLIKRRSKKTSKLRVTGLCVGNSPGPVNSPHKGPVTRKMFPFDDVIMLHRHLVNHRIIPEPVKEH